MRWEKIWYRKVSSKPAVSLRQEVASWLEFCLKNGLLSDRLHLLEASASARRFSPGWGYLGVDPWMLPFECFRGCLLEVFGSAGS